MTDLVERLRVLDTCSVSDALDGHGLTGAVRGIVPVSGAGKLAGRAQTVELVPAGSIPPPATPRHLATAAVAASGAGQVIVISHPGGDMAGWGGLLSFAAHQGGIEGTVIDGNARDVDESDELGYTVFARATTPITARGRLVEKQWGEPIMLAGVPVAPGDLVLADGSGVVFVPADRAEEIIAAAESFSRREQAMAEDVRRGVPITEVMGKSYETMTEQGAQQ